jgi:hypothetical protein
LLTATGWITWRIFLKQCWCPYTESFKDLEARFLEHAGLVEKEARIQRILEYDDEKQQKSQLEAIKTREKKSKGFPDYGSLVAGYYHIFCFP